MRDEFLDERTAQARLAQLGAEHRPDVSAGGAYVYWSGRYRVWIQATRHGTGYKLAFSQDCPCSGGGR